VATLADALVLAAWSYLALSGSGRDWDFFAFGIALAIVLWLDVKPYRTATARVRLSSLAGWLLVFRFVVLVFLFAFANVVRPVGWAIAAAALLFVIGAVLRLMEERTPLRLISAAPGGGFLVRYPADEAIDAELTRLPEGARDGGGWRFPATKDAADALLRFAREHDFQFKP
jgi:hypothetical protein